MRISLHTLGTRGDMQPFLALAVGLKRRGHDVVMVAPAQFERAATAEGIDLHPMPREFLDLVDSPEAKAMLGGGRGGGLKAGMALMKEYKRISPGLFNAEWEAARDFRPDVILHHAKALGAPHIAENLGVPLMLASPLPGFTPTSAFPSPLVPVSSLGPLNRISHSLTASGGAATFRGTLRTWRSEVLKLPSRGSGAPLRGTLYGYSPQVLPKPADWDEDVAVTGYWFLEAPAWEPDTRLAAFLTAGEAPIYVGFGSMPGQDPRALTTMVVEGLRLAGKRGLIASGGGALDASVTADHIHHLEGAPHDQLFPLMRATLHHGGAGTTGAALRAGKPTAILPFFGDQPFWANRIRKLGVGPKPLDKKRLSAESFAEAFRAMEHLDMHLRAERLGAAIRKEDGTGQAVDFIEQRVTPPNPLRHRP